MKWHVGCKQNIQVYTVIRHLMKPKHTILVACSVASPLRMQANPWSNCAFFTLFWGDLIPSLPYSKGINCQLLAKECSLFNGKLFAGGLSRNFVFKALTVPTWPQRIENWYIYIPSFTWVLFFRFHCSIWRGQDTSDLWGWGSETLWWKKCREKELIK